jgi:hypothetical protein
MPHIRYTILIASAVDIWYELDGKRVPKDTPGAQKRTEGGASRKGISHSVYDPSMSVRMTCVTHYERYHNVSVVVQLLVLGTAHWCRRLCSLTLVVHIDEYK